MMGNKFGNWPIDEDEAYREIERALQSLAKKGLIVDTGDRRWSARRGEWQIVWASSKFLRH
jgi:hypothetical protein